jgi:hypothetical protein
MWRRQRMFDLVAQARLLVFGGPYYSDPRVVTALRARCAFRLRRAVGRNRRSRISPIDGGAAQYG